MKFAAHLFLVIGCLLFGTSGTWAQEEAPTESNVPVKTWAFLREQGMTGSMRWDYFQSSKIMDDQADFLGATGQIKLLPMIRDGMDGKIEVRVTNPDIGDRGDTDITFLEGYVTLHFQRADIRIGKQIVAWGRADGMNPTDNLTPRDFTVLLPFEEDQRFGITALKIDGYLTTGLTLTLFTTPFFEPSKIPLGPSIGGPLTEDRPAHRLSNSEVGVKLDHTGGRLDWSVSYFHGFDPLPDARIIGLSPSGPARELRYPRIHVFGADMARNFGRYGFRAEAAYFLTQDRNGQDPAIKNPFLFYVVGMDRTLLENLNVNLQFIGRWVQDFNDPEAIIDPIVRTVAIQNAIFDNQQDPASYGLTSRISDKWFNDTFEAEILLFINFKRTNAYVRPLITYAFTDHLKGTLGGEIYHGSENSYFGRLQNNQGAFTEVRYSF